MKHPELRSVGQVTMRGDVEYLDSCPNWAKLTQQEAGKEGDSTEGERSGFAVVCGCAWLGSSGLKTAVTAGFAEDPYADFQELQPTAVAYTYTHAHALLCGGRRSLSVVVFDCVLGTLCDGCESMNLLRTSNPHGAHAVTS